METKPLSAHIKSSIEAAFEKATKEANLTGARGACVQRCKDEYYNCMDTGHGECRRQLEACINSCPNGMNLDQKTRDSLIANLSGH